MVGLGHTRSRTGLQAGAHCVPTLKSNRSIPTQVIYSLHSITIAPPARCTGCSARQNACRCSWGTLQSDECLHALPCGCSTLLRLVTRALNGLQAAEHSLPSEHVTTKHGACHRDVVHQISRAKAHVHSRLLPQPAPGVHVSSQTVEQWPGSYRQSAAQ